MSGRLSVVATPIGCLEDITLRAIRTLRQADLILTEDTRRARTLCAQHGISTPLRSFHAYSSTKEVDAIVDALSNGAHYALVSDAGTPLVSDPGNHLVARAATAGVVVEAIPGPSAVLASLCVSGIPAHRFSFEGFLPRSGAHRKQALERIKKSEITVVLFESPHRIHATLADLEHTVGGQRRIALCRELTKLHEETIRGPVAQVRHELPTSVRGEITVVVKGDRQIASTRAIDVEILVHEWKKQGLSTKEMAQRLQRDLGWKRTLAYQAVLDALKESKR